MTGQALLFTFATRTLSNNLFLILGSTEDHMISFHHFFISVLLFALQYAPG